MAKPLSPIEMRYVTEASASVGAIENSELLLVTSPRDADKSQNKTSEMRWQNTDKARERA